MTLVDLKRFVEDAIAQAVAEDLEPRRVEVRVVTKQGVPKLLRSGNVHHELYGGPILYLR